MAWNENSFDRQLEALQELIGYRFSQRDLLVQAMTHRSFANELGETVPDNERLEFLGDAVLELVVSRHLYRSYETMSEGQMTRARAAIVRAGSLAQAARQLALGELLRLGRGEELTGGRDKESVLADGMEALFGALYLDGGFQQAEMLISLLGDHFDSPGKLVALDPKSRLQELLQRSQDGTPYYEVVEQFGPPHDVTFVVQVRVGDRCLATGQGASKKAAETDAAFNALKQASR
jgi:ribonuclease-3